MGVGVHWASIVALMFEKIEEPSKFKDIDDIKNNSSHVMLNQTKLLHITTKAVVTRDALLFLSGYNQMMSKLV